MAIVAATLFLLLGLRGSLLSAGLAFLGLFVVLPLLVLRYIIQSFFSADCPTCHARTLERWRVETFGHRYAHCSSCGARYKKSPLGGWREAAGSADEAAFATYPELNPWSAGEVDLAEGPASVSLDQLVQSKRERHTGES
jgi:hypothetical protein